MQTPGQPAAVLAARQATVALLETEIERLRQQTREHIGRHDSLERDAALLRSIPGVGELTAWDL